ncbi:MAG TPA: hypothetical protein VIH95_00955 [Acidimicrobiales bacterium]
MPDGPDPLGKRALFWMPVEPEADGDALLDGPGGLAVEEAPAASGPRHARPAGRHALFSDATPADEPERDRAAVTAGDSVHDRGILTVACSRCGSVTRVGPLEFLVLHFPVGAWLPGRTFDRWMTCPACRNRAWTSVSLTR